jgi:hypothetical protein
LHTRLAANTALVIKINDPIFAPKKRGNRANFNTGSVIAVIAAHHREVSLRMGELALFNIFHPGAIHPDGSFMLRLAGHSAGMTADALPIINNEPEIHGNLSFADVLVSELKLIGSI